MDGLKPLVIMALDFVKYAMKGNEFLNRLELNLGTQDRAQASRILRSTFRVLRCHLPFEESLQLLSQLPMAIKSVYVDGWRIADREKSRTLKDIVIEILHEEGDNALRDFSTVDDLINSVQAVVNTMKSYVSEEEMDQALDSLPQKVRIVFESDNR